MPRRSLPLLAAALLLSLAACGPRATGAAQPSPDAAAGMCPEGTPDCVDTPGLDEPVEIDETGIAQLRRDAQTLLGWEESELGDVVRVGRRGDEHLMLTEDYVIGRITVELDPDADGVHRVTSATVELPDGPETFTTDV